MSGAKHPRDAFITIYGRKPVLEALRVEGVAVDKVLVAKKARGAIVDEIEELARRAGAEVMRVDPREVTRISRNAKQDQGIVADVVAPAMDALARWLSLPASEGGPAARCHLLVLDGLTNPQNVGMILRTAVAAGLDGVVVPRRGCPEVGPLVVKGSAGVAFRARILRTPSAAEALAALGEAGFVRYALAGEATDDLFSAPWPDRAVFVLGNETFGVGEGARARIDRHLRIPMTGGVESLNVAVAGALVAYEVARRRAAGGFRGG